MRPKSGIRDLLVGNGLVVALTLTLSVATGLALAIFLVERVGTRTVVVTQHQTTLVASQMSTDPIEHTVSDHAEESGGDSMADPSGVHPEAPAANVADQHDGPPSAAEPADEHPVVTDNPVTAAAAPGADPPSGEPPAAAATEPPASEPPAAQVPPTPTLRGPPRGSADLPIVMYHHVGPLPPNPDVFRRDLTVSPDVFERTLVQLEERGVETVTMADLFEHFAGGAALPTRSVVLTFDDGYDDGYEHAFRLLKEHGMVGTFFVTTDFVDRPGYLTWEQVAEMADAGMEIAAHSTNHADFSKIGPNELRRQLVEPKALLESHIGRKVRFLAYPAGKYNPAVMAASRAAGYEAAVTVLHGTRHVPGSAFELRRVRARGADTVNEIIARMTLPSWRQ